MKTKQYSSNPMRCALFLCLLGGVFSAARAEEAPAAGEPKPPPPWDVTGNLGFTATSGNSETLLATAGVQAKRDWTDRKLDLGVSGAYGENDHVRNLQTAHGYGQYNQDITERWFWYGRADLLHDGIADIEYRFTIGPGIGYYFIKKERMTLSGEVGPSWVYERKGQVTSDYFALRLAERFDYKISDTAKFYQTFEVLPQVDRFSNYVANFEAGLESAITDTVSLAFYVLDTYVNEPAPGRKHNDIKFIAGLKYKFL
jgi:putative salt-induced outer membrane protein YdiY